uniref:Keratin, type I cytoskeletal 9-like n=1 Tax=Parastrongyloides trichosuri TaxID=131310 RepID=A0A0N4Z7C6_PARTI
MASVYLGTPGINQGGGQSSQGGGYNKNNKSSNPVYDGGSSGAGNRSLYILPGGYQGQYSPSSSGSNYTSSSGFSSPASSNYGGAGGNGNGSGGGFSSGGGVGARSCYLAPSFNDVRNTSNYPGERGTPNNNPVKAQKSSGNVAPGPVVASDGASPAPLKEINSRSKIGSAYIASEMNAKEGASNYAADRITPNNADKQASTPAIPEPAAKEGGSVMKPTTKDGTSLIKPTTTTKPSSAYVSPEMNAKEGASNYAKKPLKSDEKDKNDDKKNPLLSTSDKPLCIERGANSMVGTSTMNNKSTIDNKNNFSAVNNTQHADEENDDEKDDEKYVLLPGETPEQAKKRLAAQAGNKGAKPNGEKSATTGLPMASSEVKKKKKKKKKKDKQVAVHIVYEEEEE